MNDGLPKVYVFDPSYTLVGKGKNCYWQGLMQYVEVLTLHLEKGKMRVRGLSDKGTPKVWNTEISAFNQNYKIVGV